MKKQSLLTMIFAIIVGIFIWSLFLYLVVLKYFELNTHLEIGICLLFGTFASLSHSHFITQNERIERVSHEVVDPRLYSFDLFEAVLMVSCFGWIGLVYDWGVAYLQLLACKIIEAINSVKKLTFQCTELWDELMGQ